MAQHNRSHPWILPGPSWIDQFGWISPTSSARLTGWLTTFSASLLRGLSQVSSTAADVLFSVLFPRDGDSGEIGAAGLLPLTAPEFAKLRERVENTVRATVYGTVMVAALQGALGGMCSGGWIFPRRCSGVSSWAFYPSFPSSAPSSYGRRCGVLALAGHWVSALLLTLWGTAVIGLIDNVLYPVLVGSRLMLHTVPAFIAVVGGIILFGTPGLILGPLVVTVSLVLLWIWRERLIMRRPHRLKKDNRPVSLESVRAFFALHAPDVKVIELSTSTATVDLAAAAHGVSPGQIAKTLSMRIGERIVLVVARGDARLDNRKIKSLSAGRPGCCQPMRWRH